MTDTVPSLTELAAIVVSQNYDVAQLQPRLANELVEYVGNLSGEIPLHVATEFYDSYYELFQSFSRVGGQDVDPTVLEELLAKCQNVLLDYDRASQMLTTALSAAFEVVDQEWREYLVHMLSEVQENVNTLGGRAESLVEHLTWLRDA